MIPASVSFSFPLNLYKAYVSLRSLSDERLVPVPKVSVVGSIDFDH